MKLIPNLSLDEDEPLLPDSPRANLPWYTRMLRRGLIQLFSNDGLTILAGAILTVLLTLLISLNYLEVAQDVDKNGISLKDFYADSRLEVVDQDATQRKVDRALTPIYQNAEPHNQDILESLAKLTQRLGEIATNPASSSLERRAEFHQVAGNFPHAERIEERYFKKAISSNEWAQISLASQKGMQKILRVGFTEAQADNAALRQQAIRQSSPSHGYSHQYFELVGFLLDSTLEPNRILDERAMSKSRKELSERMALDNPEVIVFSEGQKIVSQGERVTPMQRAALAQMGKSVSRNNWIACLGVFLLCSFFVWTLWNYLYHFQEKQFFHPSYAALLGTLTLVITLFFQILDQGTLGHVPIYAFPLAAYAMMLAIFMHPHVSILATTLLVFLMVLAMRVDYYPVSVLLFGSYMGVYILHRRTSFSDRGQLIYAGFYVGATNALGLLAIGLLHDQDVHLRGLLSLVGWGLFSGVLSGILAVGTMPLLESIFRVVTPFTLMELGNHDQPLLKRMQFEAPGTFHHSLMVASLAETAAEAIGANALLTRVGCLYHDIGKMKRPLFFIENQAYFGVENPHDKLTPRLSKMVITAHPRDSLEMAKQHKLPEVLMRFMTEHHGTLMAGYFYNKACQEEGPENVTKSQFRYPGPKPGSKETAIVMLADACESAVRALKSPTTTQVEERIDKIIQQRIEDGQFDHCPITFKDIELIKQTFVRVLRGIQHSRIEYQQSMMRELGRKLPVTTITEHAGMQETLKQIQAIQPDQPDKPKPDTNTSS